MDLCLMIEGQMGVTWDQWVALARACEEHGIPALFRSDHYLNLGQDLDRGSHEAWGTLCGLAALTSTVRLGTMVTPTSFRHPSVLAKLVATADHISGGRIDVGIGAGWHEREHEAYGFPFLSTRERLDVFEEQLEILVGSWADGAFSFSGQHYRLENLDALPKPVQRPRPPVIFGGSGGPRSVRLAARFADEYNTAFTTPERVRELRAGLVEACERAGREPMPFSVMTTVIVGSDEAELRDHVRRVSAVAGTDPDRVLSDPPTAWVVGTVDRVVEQLTELGEAGASRVMCQHLAHDELDTVALIGDELRGRVAAV
jgi:F420-dependent oxidoreductase-like protein